MTSKVPRPRAHIPLGYIPLRLQAGTRYETKIRELNVRLALNVDHVFDRRDPIITSYDGGWKDVEGSPIPNGYYFQAPRTFRFTARVAF